MRPLFASLLLAFATAALAADFEKERLSNWHHWRGPAANGAAAPDANPPTTWDAASGKNVKWKAAIPGRGTSTPIVWGDSVFVLTAIKTDRVAKPEELPKIDPGLEKRTDPPTNFYRFVVLCLDRATGAVQWERVAAEAVPHEGHHTTHSYAAGSPTTDGDRLYVSFGSFGVFCYDFGGKLLWTRDLGRLATRLGWGEATTPVVHGDSLLLNWDQEVGAALYCLDTKTGQDKWVAKRDEKSTWTTPLVAEHGGRTQVVLNGANRIRSYDLRTGEEIWSCGGMTVNPIPSLVRVGDSVVAMSGYRGAAAVSIPLDSKGDLGGGDRVGWRYGRGTPYVPSPAVVGDRLWFTERNEGLLTVLDAKTGKPVIDRERLPGVTSFYASPVAASGRVYLVDRTGVALVLKAGDSLEVLATNRLGEGVDASPAAVGGELFLRGEKHLFCLAAK